MKDLISNMKAQMRIKTLMSVLTAYIIFFGVNFGLQIYSRLARRNDFYDSLQSAEALRDSNTCGVVSQLVDNQFLGSSSLSNFPASSPHPGVQQFQQQNERYTIGEEFASTEPPSSSIFATAQGGSGVADSRRGGGTSARSSLVTSDAQDNDDKTKSTSNSNFNYSNNSDSVRIPETASFVDNSIPESRKAAVSTDQLHKSQAKPLYVVVPQAEMEKWLWQYTYLSFLKDAEIYMSFAWLTIHAIAVIFGRLKLRRLIGCDPSATRPAPP